MFICNAVSFWAIFHGFPAAQRVRRAVLSPSFTRLFSLLPELEGKVSGDRGLKTEAFNIHILLPELVSVVMARGFNYFNVFFRWYLCFSKGCENSSTLLSLKLVDGFFAVALFSNWRLCSELP